MKHVLALLAALALFALAPIQPQAHAGTCSQSLLISFSTTWAKTEFNPDLVCQNNSPYCPNSGGPVGGNGCNAPNHMVTCVQCSEQGVSGWWDFSSNQGCGYSPLTVSGWVQYRPNHLYTYTWICSCSEGVYSCHWT